MLLTWVIDNYYHARHGPYCKRGQMCACNWFICHLLYCGMCSQLQYIPIMHGTVHTVCVVRCVRATGLFVICCIEVHTRGMCSQLQYIPMIHGMVHTVCVQLVYLSFAVLKFTQVTCVLNFNILLHSHYSINYCYYLGHSELYNRDTYWSLKNSFIVKTTSELNEDTS